MAQLNLPNGQMLDTEVSTLSKRNVDYLAESKDGVLIHIEFQRKFDKRMSIRMIDYAGSILWHYRGGEGHTLPRLKQRLIHVANREKSELVQAVFGSVGIRYESKNTLEIDAAPLIEDGDASDLALSALCKMDDEERQISDTLGRIRQLSEIEYRTTMNDYLALSLASKRYETVTRVIANMGIELTEEDFPIIEAVNKKTRLDQAVRMVASLASAYNRPLSGPEIDALRELSVNEIENFNVDFSRADDKDALIGRRLFGALKP